jgi:tetratricopeptide (TPR) repeat protein
VSSTRTGLAALGLSLLWVAFAVPAAGQVPSFLAGRLSERNLFTQMGSLLEQGDLAGAEAFLRENVQALGEELQEILDDVDRGFDELGRQKARNDIMQQGFRQIEVDLAKSEMVFQLYSELTGQGNYLARFQAKRLRIKGAEHTNHADFLWDSLEYEQALQEYAEAIRALQEAIPLAQSVKDHKLLESCLNNIGYAAIYSGDHADGLSKFSEALEVAEERGDPIHQGQYLLNLGTFYLYVGQPEDSLRYSLRAVEVIQKIGRRTWEANALLNLGSSYLVMNQNEQALSYFQKALQKSQEANDRRSHGRALYNLALITARSEEWEGAADLMAQALGWYQDNEEVYARAERTVLRYHGLSFLSSTHRRLNNREKAAQYTRELADLSAQDSSKLAAYLADPHLNFYKWQDFRDRKNRETGRF